MTATQLVAALLLPLLLTAVVEAADTDDGTTLVWNVSNPKGLEWRIVNDTVMGGVSRSRVNVTNDVARFTGEVSLENNGGFASMRTRSTDLKLPAEANAFLIRVKGDGKTYRFVVRRKGAGEDFNYQLPFETKAGEWSEVRLPMEQFEASWHGRPRPEEPTLRAPMAEYVGIIIAEQTGSFQLEVEWIKAVR